MRILFFLGFYNPFPGAAWTRISSLAKFLSRTGYKIDILGAFTPMTLARDRINARRFKPQHLISLNNFVLTFGLSYKIAFVFLFNMVSSFLVSVLYLLIKEPKVTIASLPPGDTGLGFIMAALLLKKQLIIDHRDEWTEDCCISPISTSTITKKFYSLFVRKILLVFYNRAFAVTTVTNGFKSSLLERGIRNVLLIQNGADVTTFKPLKEKDSTDGLTIIYSGLIGNYYSFDELLLALRYLKNYATLDIKLVFVGDRNSLPYILNLASRLELGNCIEYKGALNIEELVKVIANADVGLIPGLYSNMQLPVKFFEYCACGIPVLAVVPDDSMLKQLIDENRVGLTCKPHNIKGLSDALEKIYFDKSFRESSGKRARLLIEQCFDRNKINESFFTLLQETIRDRCDHGYQVFEKPFSE
jgi:glycosyltransferase involved in cell wall biosynthesis